MSNAKSQDHFSGFKPVGGTYSSITYARMFAWLAFTGAAFSVILPLILMTETGTFNTNGLVMTVILVVLGVVLSKAHNTSPQGKYTVLSNYRREDGIYASEIRFADGTTSTHEYGNGEGFWTQFARLVKATVTGK